MNHHIFSRDAEYAADLFAVARRALEPFEQRIFERYLLMRRPWTEFTGMPARGQFFHAVYRTEQKYGAALIEFGVFPPHAYFSGVRLAEPEQQRNKKFYWMRDPDEEEPRPPLTGEPGFRCAPKEPRQKAA